MDFFIFTYHSEMKCPISGKNCTKHKSFELEGQVVCEDCLHKKQEQIQAVGDMTCSSCGISLAQIVKGSRFGCPSCYDSFADMVPHLIASVQACDSAVRHVGIAPQCFLSEKSKSMSYEEIRDEIGSRMNAASSKEDYTEAARMKSSLSRLENIMKEGQGDHAERLALFVLEFWAGSESGR